MNPVFRLVALACCFLATSAVGGAQNFVAEKWEVLEIVLDGGGDKIDQPFRVELRAVFRSGGGEQMEIPGFYDGSGNWKIRFSLPEAGEWTYETLSSLPSLAGKTGSVKVSEKGGNGPIGVSKDEPQKLVYADGKPYPLLAFELDWLFALDAENPDGIPRARRIVDKVAAEGFNQIVLNVFAYDAKFGEKDKIHPSHDFSKPKAFPFGGSNETPDHSTLSVEYFQRFDRIISYLEEKGIVAHLMIYVWNKQVNWPAPGSDDDNLYFDYVVKRYQGFPNLIWNISKEALDYDYVGAEYVTGRIDRLRRLDGHRRLLSVHDYKYCALHPEKVDFISIQEWAPYLYEKLLSVRQKHSDKPIFVIEHGGYEKTMMSIFDGAYTDPVVCLNRAWQCFFAGAYPTYYWQNAAWYHVVHDIDALPPENRPNLEYYRHMQLLMTRFSEPAFEPMVVPFAPPILADRKKHRYLFYLPEDRLVIAGGIEDLKGKTMRIEWFNPLTGKSTDGGERFFEKNGWLGIKRPDGIESPMVIAILSEKE